MTADRFDFVDLFAGIGGFHLALRGLGGRCVLAVDNDVNCESTYTRNFRGTPFLQDITELTTQTGLRKIPRHDVLCAGFPCQPFSKSGHQLGLRDRTRGTLFFHIMEVVRARRPRFVILENVRNLAGPRHRDTWDVIIRSLRSEGYRVSDDPVVFSPHLLRRSYGGRPQVRERVYILAELQPAGTKRIDLQFAPLVANRPVGDWRPSDWDVGDILDDDELIPQIDRYRLRPDEIRWLDAWQAFIQRLDEELPGFPIWADEFKERPDVSTRNPSWKNTFLMKNSELFVRNKRMIERWRDEYNIDDFPDSRKKFEWQARGYDRDLWKLLIHLRPSGIRVKAPTYVPALVAITQTSIVGARRRRLTPREAARLQGFPNRFVLHKNEVIAYRQLGNAVNVGVTRYLARALFNSSELGWPGHVANGKLRRRARSKPTQLRFLESA